MSQNKFWQNKRVLITGHEGFLGSWLVNHLVDAGADVIGIDKVIDRKISVLNGARKQIQGIKGSVASFRFVRKIFQEYKPQIVFHLAAEAIVGDALKNPMNTFKANIEGTWNVLESARMSSGVEAIVVASSDKAYGSHDNLPYREDIALQGDRPYDVSKSCTDLLCQTYYKTYGLPVCITRCGNIYGPGDFHFSRIVPDAIRSALNEKSFIIRSNGKYTRDYIYVDDIVRAYVLLAEKVQKLNLAGEAFNFSNEDPIDVLGLHEKIQKAVSGRMIQPQVLDEAKDEIKHQYLSAKKAKTILKWQGKHSLGQGLKKTVEWYRQYV